MRRGMAVAVLGVVALALAGCGGSSAISLPCSPQPGGRLCITVFRDGSKVTDAIGYLSASEPPLAGKTWRLALTAAGHAYPGRTRHGNAPRATVCTDSYGATVTTPAGCHSVLASDYASMGDYAGFAVPKRLPAGSELCVTEQIETGGAWKTQATPTPACSKTS